MDDLDSLLADLERATTNLKNNPQRPGGWKLNNGPGDVTINSEPTYSTAKVAKHYSPQYYVPEEPIYQNGGSLKRSQSNGSAYHDYARINGAGDSFDSRDSTPILQRPSMHTQGSRGSVDDCCAVHPIEALPRNHGSDSPTSPFAISNSLPRNHRSHSTGNSHPSASAKSAASSSTVQESISQKLSLLDHLLDDLNSMPNATTNQRNNDSVKTQNYSTMPHTRTTSPLTSSFAAPSARSPSPDSVPTYATLKKVPTKSVTVITKGPSTYIHSKGPARGGHQPNGNYSNGTISYVNGGAPSRDATVSNQNSAPKSNRSDEAQVNELIKDLEFSLQSNGYHQSPHHQKPTYTGNGASSTLSPQKPKSVTFEDGMSPAKQATQVDHVHYQPSVVHQQKQAPVITYSNGTGAQLNNGNTNGRSPSPTRAITPIVPDEEYHRNLVNLQPQQVRMNSNPIIEVPVGSHATRELDDLMASLSDFKMTQIKTNGQEKKGNYINLGQVQVPRKGHGERQMLYKPANPNVDLESMIGDLEADMNRHGVNVGPKGDCGACGRPIVGQVVAALGKMFHPEHFRCAKCNTELGDKAFFERDEVAYCQDDYHRLFSPKCNYCSKPILDRCITALDKTWHPEHFFCAHCGKNFGDDGYHEKSGAAYCREDFFKLFAPKCMGCYSPIVDNYVEAMGGHWHQDCFVCRDCNEPFHGGNFFDFEGNPYCEPHFHTKKGNMCATCRGPIAGRCITAMNQKYHPEHFTCSFCLKQLNKGTFKKHQEKPYCHSCFEKLFA